VGNQENGSGGILIAAKDIKTPNIKTDIYWEEFPFADSTQYTSCIYLSGSGFEINKQKLMLSIHDPIILFPISFKLQYPTRSSCCRVSYEPQTFSSEHLPFQVIWL
jgi:hypothetical protein